jgi:hypothetical protein
MERERERDNLSKTFGCNTKVFWVFPHTFFYVARTQLYVCFQATGVSLYSPHHGGHPQQPTAGLQHGQQQSSSQHSSWLEGCWFWFWFW